jgi:hypothetical protein
VVARQLLLLGLRYSSQQLLQSLPPLWRHEPELRQVAAHGIDQPRALADQQVTCPVQHQRSLLLGALDRNEAHRPARPRDESQTHSGSGAVAVRVGPRLVAMAAGWLADVPADLKRAAELTLMWATVYVIGQLAFWFRISMRKQLRPTL